MLMYAVSLEHQGRGRAIREELQEMFMKGAKVTSTEGFARVHGSDRGGGNIADNPIGCTFRLPLARGHPFDSQLPGVERAPPSRGMSPPSIAGLGWKLGNPETEFS